MEKILLIDSLYQTRPGGFVPPHRVNTAADSGPTIRSRGQRRGRIHQASASPQQQFDEPPQRLDQENANGCAVSRARWTPPLRVVCSHQICGQSEAQLWGDEQDDGNGSGMGAFLPWFLERSLSSASSLSESSSGGRMAAATLTTEEYQQWLKGLKENR